MKGDLLITVARVHWQLCCPISRGRVVLGLRRATERHSLGSLSADNKGQAEVCRLCSKASSSVQCKFAAMPTQKYHFAEIVQHSRMSARLTLPWGRLHKKRACQPASLALCFVHLGVHPHRHCCWITTTLLLCYFTHLPHINPQQWPVTTSVELILQTSRDGESTTTPTPSRADYTQAPSRWVSSASEFCTWFSSRKRSETNMWGYYQLDGVIDKSLSDCYYYTIANLFVHPSQMYFYL